MQPGRLEEDGRAKLGLLAVQTAESVLTVAAAGVQPVLNARTATLLAG